MKKIFFLIIVGLISFYGKSQVPEIPSQDIPEEYGYIVKIGQEVPDFEMTLTDGTNIKISELKGKVVMLQFTASWCSVCRKEMPHIENDIWKKHKTNNNFALFGVDMDEPLEKVRNFKEEIKITYPLGLDPGAEIFYKFAAEGAGVTRNVVIDKEGKIRFMTRLFEQEEFDEMKQVIDKLLHL